MRNSGVFFPLTIGHCPVDHFLGVVSGVYSENAFHMSADVLPGCVRLMR